jgi:hypothetical protein
MPARILIAASRDPREIAERILTGHKLTCAGTLPQALKLLREKTFDLILVTIAFDESRMFDLVVEAKSILGRKNTPVVCARLRGAMFRSPAAMKAIALTCKTLGAAAFIDIADLHEDQDRNFRAALDQILEASL